MSHHYERLFASLDRTTVPDTLLASTLARVRAAARVQARRRLALLGVGTLGVGAATGVVGYFILNTLQSTGFYYYVSLFATHDLAIFAYWRELMFSILATLPLFEASLFLFGLTIFIWLAAQLYSTARYVRTLAPSYA